ncbi:hypothetical protein SLS56_004444 [Neofusicoccum ribis]|uniref:DUF7708 domain-containing protein n=1 Tax=Neofusicoccum ribis TaxID=45134 RepID=A0ABR3SWB5_9PEZI
MCSTKSIQAITNHEDMTKQLSKASSIVADLLPKTKLTLILYPTEPIREAVALLYSRILGFILNAVRWYRQGRLKHAWNALANPWALSFKDDMDEIGDVARTVESLSKGAAKAELRETHLELMQTRSELQNLTQYVKTEFQRMAEMALGKF